MEDYAKLKEEYTLITSFTDIEFVENVSKVLHLSVIIADIKEIPPTLLLSRGSLLEQLASISHLGVDSIISLTTVREDFNELLKLC